MKRFGSIFPFIEAGRQPRHIGRLVANHDFVRAVVKYGSFDEFVFSNPSVGNLAMFAEAARGWGLSDERLARLRFVSYVGLPSLLAAEPFHVFHLGGWGWLMPGLHYLRARYAPVAWPITAITHSLNGRDVVDHAVRLSHAVMAPYDAIFCTSRDGREAMRNLLAGASRIVGRHYQGRLEHLPLGIDDDLVDARGDRERARTRLRISGDACVLLVLGRITPFQKMDLAPLLRVFARRILPACPRPAVLLLAGSATPDDLKRLKEAVEALGIGSAVRLYANFPLEQKADLLAASDMLVSPVDNAQETFGLSLLEAQAAGLPVVASRYDGYKDLVEDGGDGFLIETIGTPTDPMADWFDLLDPNTAQLFQSQGVAVDMEQLAGRVLELATDESRRAAMGRAARYKVDREYRWSRVIARYEEAWERLASEARDAGVVRPADARSAYALGPSVVFPHYSSTHLELDDRMVATALAVDLPPYNEIATLLRPELLSALLVRLQEPRRVGDLIGGESVSPEVRYALCWLLKYGYARRMPAGELS